MSDDVGPISRKGQLGTCLRWPRIENEVECRACSFLLDPARDILPIITMGIGLEFQAEDQEFSIATFQNSLLWCFRGAVTLPRVESALPIHRNLAEQYPKGFAVVTIIGENVPLSMSPEARDLSAKITKDFMPNYCGVCEVVLGVGFRAAAVRSITAGIRLIARSTCPAKVFGDATACSNWLGPLMSPHNASDSYIRLLAQSVDRVGRGFD